MKKLLSVWPFSIPYTQLYFLQLENYELKRFLALVPRSYILFSLRKDIVWTPKAIAIANLTLLLELVCACLIGFAFFSSWSAALLAAVIAFIVFLLIHFVFLSIATLCIRPFDALAKYRIVSSARRELAKHPHMKVVGIAGSYGKTTMKEVLGTVLSEKLKVVTTPGNLNTPIGISRTILNDLKVDTDVFVVELGEHYPGDLAFLSRMVSPDIVVVTGIGEAHLERFGSFDALVAGIFEVFSGLKEGGFGVLNSDNAVIRDNYKRYVGGQGVVFYSSSNQPLSSFSASGLEFQSDGSGLSFLLSEKLVAKGKFDTKLMGEYVVGLAAAALVVGKYLGLTDADVVQGFRKVKPIEHRLQVVPSGNGVLVIDDSYNGNPEGARYAIETLARFKDRRKIYVTPGLVETGSRAEEVHHLIGQELASVADVVVLIKNSVTSFIAEGLVKNGFADKDILWFKTATEAHAAIPLIVRGGDVILFQNDWPDNYS